MRGGYIHVLTAAMVVETAGRMTGGGTAGKSGVQRAPVTLAHPQFY